MAERRYSLRGLKKRGRGWRELKKSWHSSVRLNFKIIYRAEGDREKVRAYSQLLEFSVEKDINPTVLFFFMACLLHKQACGDFLAVNEL